MGNESSKSDSDRQAKAAIKVGIGVGLVITTIFCPPLGASMAASGVLTGGTFALAGELSGNEEMAEAGRIVAEPSALVSAGQQMCGINPPPLLKGKAKK